MGKPTRDERADWLAELQRHYLVGSDDALGKRLGLSRQWISEFRELGEGLERQPKIDALKEVLIAEFGPKLGPEILKAFLGGPLPALTPVNGDNGQSAPLGKNPTPAPTPSSLVAAVGKLAAPPAPGSKKKKRA